MLYLSVGLLLLGCIVLCGLTMCDGMYMFECTGFVIFVFFLMIRRPPRSTQSRSSAASDVYKRQSLKRSKTNVAGCMKPPIPTEK